MTEELLGNDEWRERFVRYCVECARDTMPHDRTGRCMWCDTLLVGEEPEPQCLPPDVVLCRNGLHPMTEANTYVAASGTRCRACRRANWTRTAERRRRDAA